jgi:hypothetical protein
MEVSDIELTGFLTGILQPVLAPVINNSCCLKFSLGLLLAFCNLFANKKGGDGRYYAEWKMNSPNEESDCSFTRKREISNLSVIRMGQFGLFAKY